MNLAMDRGHSLGKVLSRVIFRVIMIHSFGISQEIWLLRINYFYVKILKKLDSGESRKDRPRCNQQTK